MFLNLGQFPEKSEKKIIDNANKVATTAQFVFVSGTNEAAPFDDVIKPVEKSAAPRSTFRRSE